MHKQAEQFFQYYEMLVETNKVMNLTAITEFDEVLQKHFVDSVLKSEIFIMIQRRKPRPFARTSEG